MQILIAFCILTRLISAIPTYTLKNIQEWKYFKETFGKSYEDPNADLKRMEIYFRNKNFINNWNRLYQHGVKSHQLEMNHYTDMYPNEFRAFVNGFNNSIVNNDDNIKFVIPQEFEIPDSLDWRDNGAVTEVKDQSECGASWAFSVTGAIESQHFIKTGQLTLLSEQNLIDCSDDYGNNGCVSGNMENAFRYVKNAGGINPEVSYDYEAVKGICRFKREYAVNINGFVNVPEGDEEALKAAVASIGPVSVAIDAGRLSFQFYGSGIYFDPECSTTNLNRGMLIVGYGTDFHGTDYWLMKNSCSTLWGEDGYIRIARNKLNHCGIASAASYPVM